MFAEIHHLDKWRSVPIVSHDKSTIRQLCEQRLRLTIVVGKQFRLNLARAIL
jgi:ABC-type polysaccharide/polyol phosphate transport system ATPase subunit